MPGSEMSSTYCAAPVTFALPSLRGTGLPMFLSKVIGCVPEAGQIVAYGAGSGKELSEGLRRRAAWTLSGGRLTTEAQRARRGHREFKLCAPSAYSVPLWLTALPS